MKREDLAAGEHRNNGGWAKTNKIKFHQLYSRRTKTCAVSDAFKFIISDINSTCEFVQSGILMRYKTRLLSSFC